MTAATQSKSASFAAELPEDLAWLAENPGSPYSAEACRLILRPLPVALDKHDRELAEIRHEYGTVLIDVIKHGAVAALGSWSASALHPRRP